MPRPFACLSLLSLIFLMACSTTSGKSSLVQRPPERTSALSIHYVRHPLAANSPLQQKRFNKLLGHEEYDQLGSRIAKLSPQLLDARHLVMKRFYETVEGQPALLGSMSPADSSGLELQIMVTNAAISATSVNAETTVVFDFSATLLDVTNGVIYWRGAYRTKSVPLFRWNVAFDDDALSKLLGRIFDDLALKGAVAGTAMGIEASSPSGGTSLPQPSLTGSDANTTSKGDSGNQPALTDVNAVPLLNGRGREAYRAWIYRPSPKAFVIASDGSWRATWGKTPPGEPEDPVERAMQHCQQSGINDCKLYAVNDRVVWPVAPAAK
jgi:hypothetical protein